MEINRTPQEILYRIKFAMEGLGEPIPTTLEEGLSKMKWINEQSKDSPIWVRIRDMGLRHQNVLQAIINDLP